MHDRGPFAFTADDDGHRAFRVPFREFAFPVVDERFWGDDEHGLLFPEGMEGGDGLEGFP